MFKKILLITTFMIMNPLMAAQHKQTATSFTEFADKLKPQLPRISTWTAFATVLGAGILAYEWERALPRFIAPVAVSAVGIFLFSNKCAYNQFNKAKTAIKNLDYYAPNFSDPYLTNRKINARKQFEKAYCNGTIAPQDKQAWDKLWEEKFEKKNNRWKIKR